MTPMQAALAFGGRDFRVARSYRVAFAMTLASTFIALITFRLIAKMIGNVSSLHMTGGLFGFWVIGMAMAQVLEGAVTAPAGAVRQEQVQGTLEVLSTTPLSPAALAAGWIWYPLLNAMIGGVVMIALAGPLGLRLDHPDWLAAVVALLLSALSFAGIGILGAAAVVVIQQAAGLTRWLIGGLTLVSGVFYGTSVLPGWVRPITALSPLTHSLGALRGALLEGKNLIALRGDLLALVALTVVGLPLSIAALGLALRRARKSGTLATY